MRPKLTPAQIITPSTPMTGPVRFQASRRYFLGPHGPWGEGYPMVRPAELKYGRLHGSHARDQSYPEACHQKNALPALDICKPRPSLDPQTNQPRGDVEQAFSVPIVNLPMSCLLRRKYQQRDNGIRGIRHGQGALQQVQ